MEQFAVIGLKRFGYRVARTLADKGAEVLAIDSNMDLVEAIKDYVTQAVCLDATDEQTMRSAGLAGFSNVVVAIGGDVEASILCTAILKRLGVGQIIARASTPLHAQILEAVGAHRVVNIEDEMGAHLANKIFYRGILDRTQLALGSEVVQMRAPGWMVGRTLAQLDLRRGYQVNVIGLERPIPVVDDYGESRIDMEYINLPDPHDEIGRGDILILTGSTEAIESLLRAGEK